MKGLLEKDRRFCIEQGPVIIIAIILLGHSFVIGDPILISAECCVIACIYMLMLLLTDDRNGFSFLMTMPVDAKTYVLEKNLFTWIFLAVLWLVSRILLALSAIIFQRGEYDFVEILTSGYPCFLIAAIITAVFIALMLKYGPNSLILAFSFIILFTTALLFIAVLNGGFGLQTMFRVFDKLAEASPAVIAAISVPATALLTALFIMLGIRVMKNKEF